MDSRIKGWVYDPNHKTYSRTFGPLEAVVREAGGVWATEIVPHSEWQDLNDQAPTVLEAIDKAHEMINDMRSVIHSDLQQSKDDTERFLFAVIDEHGNVIGEAPFDGDSFAEAEREAAETLLGGTNESIVSRGWSIVPLTPELEAQYLKKGEDVQ